MHAYTLVFYAPVVTEAHMIINQPKTRQYLVNKRCTIVLLTCSGQGESTWSPRPKGRCVLESGEQHLPADNRQVDLGKVSWLSHLGYQNGCPKSGFFTWCAISQSSHTQERYCFIQAWVLVDFPEIKHTQGWFLDYIDTLNSCIFYLSNTYSF